MELKGAWPLRLRGDGRLVDNLPKEYALGFARLCRSNSVPARAGASRARNAGPGGWRWYVVCEFEWTADLIRACSKVDPRSPLNTFEDILHALAQGTELTNEQIDTAWRISGGEGIDRLAIANGYRGPSIGFTFSFIHGPQQE